MKCPRCGAESRVVDSREIAGLTRRRRECILCKSRFSTEEKLYIYEAASKEKQKEARSCVYFAKALKKGGIN